MCTMEVVELSRNRIDEKKGPGQSTLDYFLGFTRKAIAAKHDNLKRSKEMKNKRQLFRLTKYKASVDRCIQAKETALQIRKRTEQDIIRWQSKSRAV